jgi:hypothetical protein
MMRKARLAIRKVNVALDSPGYYFGTGRSLVERIGRKNRGQSTNLDRLAATVSSGAGNRGVSKLRNSREHGI